MSVVIDLPPDVERQLRLKAEREGTDLSTMLADIIVRELGPSSAVFEMSSLPSEETGLLQQVNLGIPPETWERYRSLQQRRRDEALTDDEHGELIEVVNLRRVLAQTGDHPPFRSVDNSL